jgi:hypothetical protein
LLSRKLASYWPSPSLRATRRHPLPRPTWLSGIIAELTRCVQPNQYSLALTGPAQLVLTLRQRNGGLLRNLRRQPKTASCGRTAAPYAIAVAHGGLFARQQSACATSGRGHCMLADDKLTGSGLAMGLGSLSTSTRGVRRFGLLLTASRQGSTRRTLRDFRRNFRRAVRGRSDHEPKFSGRSSPVEGAHRDLSLTQQPG